MSWITIPDKPVKYTQPLEKNYLEELDQLLEFVQASQPEATLDLLVQNILSEYVKRKNRRIPVQYDKEKFQVMLPTSLHERMEEVLHKSQERREETQMTDLVRHAIEVYFSSRKGLMKAFRVWQKQLAQEETSHDETVPLKEVKKEPTSLTRGQESENRKSDLIDEIRAKYTSPASSHQAYGDDQ